ncbi:uncharacterized protein LOC118151334 isoform X2 [Callithrix jacchus]|uniref:sterile alpha motif domain-containing protein 1-like isoform X2 n=1 Tax=Callithrix jacchus TaxID=9483 RepID=UPI0023DD4EA9|nr:sterile alpha motif domain-containing protein 1-like isoform X2 [Callithrix jacchus]
MLRRGGMAAPPPAAGRARVRGTRSDGSTRGAPPRAGSLEPSAIATGTEHEPPPPLPPPFARRALQPGPAAAARPRPAPRTAPRAAGPPPLKGPARVPAPRARTPRATSGPRPAFVRVLSRRAGGGDRPAPAARSLTDVSIHSRTFAQAAAATARLESRTPGFESRLCRFSTLRPSLPFTS